MSSFLAAQYDESNHGEIRWSSYFVHLQQVSYRFGQIHVFHGRSKHIDIRYHFIRECVERGEIILKHISREEQCADILTKALSIIKFEKMRRLLGVKDQVRQV